MSLMEITLLCVVLAGAGKAGAGWLLKKDTAREDRKRGAAQMAIKLSEYGLKKVPEFLVDYSVSDYSSMAAKLKDVAGTFLNGEAAVLEEFGQIFERVLEARLLSRDGRASIEARLQESIKAATMSSLTLVEK